MLYPGEFSSPVDVSAIIEGDPFEGVEDLPDEPDKDEAQEKTTVDDEGSAEAADKGAFWRMIVDTAILLIFGGGFYYWVIRRFIRT